MFDENLSFYIENCPSFIKSKLKEKNIKFGTKLMIQNKTSDVVYFLLNGKIKNYHSELNGDIYIEDIDSAVTILGELEALVNKEVVTSVETISDCIVLELPNEDFIKWLENDNKFSVFINKLIAQRNYDCCKRERVNAFYPLRYRVLYMILNTIYRNNLTITKDLLVEGVGSNIRSINRIVSALVNDNILEYSSGIISIKSMDKLKKELDLYNE